MIYFDSAATTLQKPPGVARAVSYAVGHLASPGRGGHEPALKAAETAYACREAAARLFRVPNPEQVVLTFNATHGLNIAIHTVVKPGSTVLISGYEHNAVTRPLAAVEGIKLKVAASPLFRPDLMLRSFEEQLTGQVDAVVFNHVSNVFGYILPAEDIAALCRRKRVPFILDASQSAGCLRVDFQALGAEFIAMPGHKGLYGPQGTGLLLCAGKAEPILRGGTGSLSSSQDMPDFLPDRLEAGTHNIAGAAGLLEGLRFVEQKGPETILRHETELMEKAAAGLRAVPGVRVYHAGIHGTQAGVLAFNLAGMDCEEVGSALARRGIAVRAGLHCAPLAHQSAGTLDTGAVRLSFSAFNTAAEVEEFTRQLRAVAAQRKAK